MKVANYSFQIPPFAVIGFVTYYAFNTPVRYKVDNPFIECALGPATWG